MKNIWTEEKNEFIRFCLYARRRAGDSRVAWFHVILICVVNKNKKRKKNPMQLIFLFCVISFWWCKPFFPDPYTHTRAKLLNCIFVMYTLYENIASISRDRRKKKKWRKISYYIRLFLYSRFSFASSRFFYPASAQPRSYRCQFSWVQNAIKIWMLIAAVGFTGEEGKNCLPHTDAHASDDDARKLEKRG